MVGFIEVSFRLRCVVWDEGGCLANVVRFVKRFNGIFLDGALVCETGCEVSNLSMERKVGDANCVVQGA